MKKVLAITMCAILVLALPLSASAAWNDKGPTNEKEIKIKEAPIEATELPPELQAGSEFVVTFTIPRAGSSWEYGEIYGLIDPETVFDEETCTYITTAMVDTSEPGLLEISFNFIMSAGKSHIRFTASFEGAVEITGGSKAPAVTYHWLQDFSDNYDGWVTGGTLGSITLDSGAALFMGSSTNEGPYSFFEGSMKEWPGDWYTSISVYLDPATMTMGEGFSYIVAINQPGGSFLDTYGFVALAGESSITLGCIDGAPGTEITSAGWFTLQHFFHDSGGTLSVDMKVIASDESVVLSETISTSYLIPTEVGGSRYARFTTINDDDGVLADDFQKYSIP
jgi:hypothetical protein